MQVINQKLSIFTIIYGSKGKVGEVQKLINEGNFIPLSVYVNPQVNFFIHVLNPLFHSVSLSGGPGWKCNLRHCVTFCQTFVMDDSGLCSRCQRHVSTDILYKERNNMNPSHIREKKEIKTCIFVFFVQLLLYVSNSENKQNDKF